MSLIIFFVFWCDTHSPVYLDRVYLWSQSAEMRHDGRNWHDVKEERSQKVVWEVSGDDWPTKRPEPESTHEHR